MFETEYHIAVYVVNDPGTGGGTIALGINRIGQGWFSYQVPPDYVHLEQDDDVVQNEAVKGGVEFIGNKQRGTHDAAAEAAEKRPSKGVFDIRFLFSFRNR